jgi:hypothetical protein
VSKQSISTEAWRCKRGALHPETVELSAALQKKPR